MSRKLNSIWPLPVYVATFANGDCVRYSFGSPVNKPLDFARGRRIACHMARNWDVVIGETGHWTSSHPYYSTAPRADIIAGSVEIDGAQTRDPYFDAPSVPPLRIVQGGKVSRKVAYGRILASLPELTFAQLDELEKVLSAVIDEKLAA